ncbi:hypothetical protein M569_04068, partial [Genlisea aurea]
EKYEDFVNVHGVLLAGSGLPVELHRKLFEKLGAENFDGGSYFQVEPVEEGGLRRLILSADSLGKDSDVFLVDHAWTFRLSDAYKQLKDIPGLVERMASLMSVDTDDEDDAVELLSVEDIVEEEFNNGDGIHSVRWLEIEDREIDDAALVSLDLPTKFPHLLALSLRGNKLRSSESVLKVVNRFKSIKALWLNHNPIVDNRDNLLENAILESCPELEIYNSRFTSKYSTWALGFCGGLYDMDNPGGGSLAGDDQLQGITSLDLSNRCIHSLIINQAFSPSIFPVLSYLNLRGNPLDENSTEQLVKHLRGFINLSDLEV